MKAARLYAFKKPLVVEEVPEPKLLSEDGVIVRVSGAGLCHTDLSYMDGLLPDVRGRTAKFPYIMGHESSGYVYKVGGGVTGLKEGDAVLVYGAVGCGMCEFCKRGEENRCSEDPITIGLSPEYEGGFAEYMYVPSYRYLLKVKGDPTDLAPLTDAGLTAYRAVKKVRSHLNPGTFSIIFGIGGLGFYALQYMKLFGVSSIIAVDINDAKLAMAKKWGADYTFKFDDSALPGKISSITGKNGVNAIVDFVGINSTANLAMKVLSNDGIYVNIGLGGGSVTIPLIYLIHSESIVTGNMWGTYNELREVYNLAESGRVKSMVDRRKLGEINDAIADLRNGKLMGRAVITP